MTAKESSYVPNWNVYEDRVVCGPAWNDPLMMMFNPIGWAAAKLVTHAIEARQETIRNRQSRS